MVYRPTVRYADEFKQYVDDLFHATTLDRNQIIRAALFTSAFSPNFKSLIEQYKKDVLLPSPTWKEHEHGYWMDKEPQQQEGGKDVNDNLRGTRQTMGTIERDTRNKDDEQQEGYKQQIERRERTFHSEQIRVRNQGGITIKIG